MPSIKRCTAINTSTGAVTFVDVDVGSGATGPAGPGVPVGGLAGQILSKIDATNYNTQWVTNSPTVADGSITNVKLATMPTLTIKGNVTGATAAPTDLTAASVKTLLALTKSDVGLGSVDNTADTAKPVSTAQQTALNLKQDKAQAINAQTGTSYTLVLTDASSVVTLSNAATIAVTVPTNATVAYPIGTSIDLIQIAAGQVTVAGASGVAINTSMPTAKFRAQFSTATLIKTATDSWVLTGDLAAS
jgi:hypothetical protein